MKNELVVADSEYRCGFVICNEWRFITDHYFTSKEEAEEFINQLKESIERVWPE